MLGAQAILLMSQVCYQHPIYCPPPPPVYCMPICPSPTPQTVTKKKVKTRERIHFYKKDVKDLRHIVVKEPNGNIIDDVPVINYMVPQIRYSRDGDTRTRHYYYGAKIPYKGQRYIEYVPVSNEKFNRPRTKPKSKVPTPQVLSSPPREEKEEWVPIPRMPRPKRTPKPERKRTLAPEHGIDLDETLPDEPLRFPPDIDDTDATGDADLFKDVDDDTSSETKKLRMLDFRRTINGMG